MSWLKTEIERELLLLQKYEDRKIVTEIKCVYCPMVKHIEKLYKLLLKVEKKCQN